MYTESESPVHTLVTATLYVVCLSLSLSLFPSLYSNCSRFVFLRILILYINIY